MRREAFRDFLVTGYRGKFGRPLSDDSAKSYCAYVAQSEVLLGLNLDQLAPSRAALDQLQSALRAAASRSGTPPGTLNNCLSGVRAYSQFLDQE